MASPNISFDTIPASIRKPGKYIEFNTKLAVRTLPGNLQKTVILAQKTAAGTQPANTPISVFSDAEAQVYFGVGSQAHLMVRAALKANPYLQLDVLPVDDAGAGIAHTKTVTLSGPATGAGVLELDIGNDRALIAIAAADAANDIAAALKAQIDLQPDLPFTATVLTNVVTLTAKNKGTQANDIAVSASVTAAGVGAVVAAGTAGATDPTLATPLAAIFASSHNVLISAWNDATSLTAIRTHLDSVSGALEQRGAVCAFGWTGSLASGTSLAASVNSGRISGALYPGSISPAYELAAAYGAEIAFEEDPARPLNTLELVNIAVPPLSSRLSRTEQENALNNGMTPIEVGPGNKSQIVRAITTYTLDPQGIPDIALLDLTTIRTLDYVRKAVRERIALRFPREKLSVRTPPKVRSEILDVLYKLEELEIVENVDAIKPGVIVEKDLQDPNRLDAKIPTDVVNGLHIFAARIDLLL